MRYLVFLLACLPLAGCATPPSIRVNTSDLQPANIKTAIAKMILQSHHSGSISIIEAKVVNATITPGVKTNGSLFYPRPHIDYCARGEIKNPLFPLNQAFYAQVRVSDDGGPRRINVRTSKLACGSPAEPFPELEALSIKREADRSR